MLTKEGLPAGMETTGEDRNGRRGLHLPGVSRPVDIRMLTGMGLLIIVLVVADVLANRTSLKFLLLPPFGALSYLVFVNPAQTEINFRRVVVCPTLVAVMAWSLATYLGYDTVSLVLTIVGTLAIMYATGAGSVVPPLSLGLLTLLLHNEVRGRVGYVLSVFAFTLAVYTVYQVWLRLPLPRNQ